MNPRRVLKLTCLLPLVVVAACGGSPEGAPASTAPSAADVGYAAPPSLTAAARRGARLVLVGQAPPNSQVQLASPEGRLFTAATDGAGAWTLELASPVSPAMFAFSAQGQDRTVRGEGAILLAPAPGPVALLLRPGFGALSPAAGGTAPAIVAVDFDASGGTAVGGVARPGAAVRLNVDGAPAGIGQADAAGRFAMVVANRTLAAGAHRIEVETDDGQAQVTAEVSPAAPLGSSAYRATRRPGGWRVDWAPPGGGVQTSLVFETGAGA